MNSLNVIIKFGTYKIKLYKDRKYFRLKKIDWNKNTNSKFRRLWES